MNLLVFSLTIKTFDWKFFSILCLQVVAFSKFDVVQTEIEYFLFWILANKILASSINPIKALMISPDFLTM